jgi:hypothetical protein
LIRRSASLPLLLLARAWVFLYYRSRVMTMAAVGRIGAATRAALAEKIGRDVQMKPRIALIAHDKKKNDMITLAGEYRDFLPAAR